MSLTTTISAPTLSPEEVASLSDDQKRALLMRAKELKRRVVGEGPKTKDELRVWVKEEIGIDVTDRAVCIDKGHCSPLDFLWEIYSGETHSALLVANRGGGKTFFVALHHYLRALFWAPYWGLSFGATGEQANRAYEHLGDWTYEIKDIEGDRRKVLKQGIEQSLRGGTHGGGKTKWESGAKVESVTGSERSVNGPHPNTAHCDEAEQVDEGTWVESRNMAIAGTTSDGRRIPAQDIITSTRKSARGRVQKLMDGIKGAIAKGFKPPQKLFMWCFVETTENQPNCRMAAENEDCPEEELCDCHLVLGPGKTEEGEDRTFDKTCAGRLWHSDGWRPLEEVHNTFVNNPPSTWQAQQECDKPSTEGNFLKWSEAKFEIYGFAPDPANGPIYTSTDWGGCYDGDTEVLTERGWVQFPDVTADDKFASMDSETRTVAFLRPKTVIAKEYPGAMERFSSKHVDLLVSSDHNMVTAPIQDYGEGEITFTRADSTPEMRRVLKDSSGREDAVDEPFVLSGVKELDDLEIAADDWAAILGLWMAEGHSEKRDRIGITHYDRDNVEEIKEIAGRYFSVSDGINWEDRRGQLRINDRRLHAHLQPLGRCWEKGVPSYVKRWSPRLLRIYLDWHARGDGSRNRIYTSSRQLADDLQEIAMYAGWAADIKVRQPRRGAYIEGREIVSDRLQYVVSVLKTRNRPWLSVRRDLGQPEIRRTVSAEEWEAKDVYIVHLPERHTLYVRRNGKAVWSGNTNPHSMHWYQRLDHAVMVVNQLGERVMLPEDALVVFDEIYVAEIATSKLAERVHEKELYWRRRYPQFKVKDRFADPQGKADRIEFKNQGLRTTWPYGSRKKDKMIKEVQSVVNDDEMVFADPERCPMWIAEAVSWKRNPKTGEELDEFNHAMSDFRYVVVNVHKLEGKERKRSLRRRTSAQAQQVEGRKQPGRKRHGPLGYAKRSKRHALDEFVR